MDFACEVGTYTENVNTQQKVGKEIEFENILQSKSLCHNETHLQADVYRKKNISHLKNVNWQPVSFLIP